MEKRIVLWSLTPDLEGEDGIKEITDLCDQERLSTGRKL